MVLIHLHYVLSFQLNLPKLNVKREYQFLLPYTHFTSSLTGCKNLSGTWRSSDGHTVNFNQDKCNGSSSDGSKYIVSGSSMTIDNGVSGIINSEGTKITCSDGIIFVQGMPKFSHYTQINSVQLKYRQYFRKPCAII